MKVLSVEEGAQTMNRQVILSLLAHHAPEMRSQFDVSDLSVFGSVARDEAREGSDLDVLVDFKGRPTFDHFMGLRFFLEDLTGMRVDLVTRQALRPQLSSAITQEAIHAA